MKMRKDEGAPLQHLPNPYVDVPVRVFFHLLVSVCRWVYVCLSPDIRWIARVLHLRSAVVVDARPEKMRETLLVVVLSTCLLLHV